MYKKNGELRIVKRKEYKEHYVKNQLKVGIFGIIINLIILYWFLIWYFF